MKKYKTALYGRTSPHDRKKLTIEAQQKALREWSVRDELVWDVVGEYWDATITGKIPLWERPEGAKLIEAIDAGKVQSVAVLYIDRLGRTTLDSLQAASRLEEKGVKLVATSDGWDARKDDDPLYFHIRAAIAEAEHRRIRKRMEDGKAMAMERDNQPPGGSLVFGYRLGPRGEFVIDPVEAAIVRHVFKMAAEGEPHSKILAWLESCGVAPGRRWQRRTGGEVVLTASHATAKWYRTRIVKMLRRRTYIGERIWKGRVFPCLPIIDRELWDRVQVICDRYKRQFDVSRLRGLCSGMLVCAACGNRYLYDHNRGYRANYRCDGRCRLRVCKADRIPVASVDGVVWSAVQEFLENPQRIIRKAIASRGKAEESLADIETEEKRITTALDAIELEVKTLTTEQTKRELPFSWILPQLDALNQRRGKLVAEQEELRSRRSAVRLDQESLENCLRLMRIEVVGDTRFASAERKRELIRQHVATVEVKSKEQILIHFRWGGVSKSPITGIRGSSYATISLPRSLVDGEIVSG